MSHLDTLRRVHALAATRNPTGPSGCVDADLAREAGMDGNLARLLQAARDLDAEQSNLPPGSMLTGTGAPWRWFGFTLAFAYDGPDLDTVRAVLDMRPGWVFHVEPAKGEALDIVATGVEQGDDPEAGFPVFLVGHRYDEDHIADNEYRGEPVRIPLAGSRVTVY